MRKVGLSSHLSLARVWAGLGLVGMGYKLRVLGFIRLGEGRFD